MQAHDTTPQSEIYGSHTKGLMYVTACVQGGRTR